MAKKRLDVLLVERNLIGSREKAKALIMAGSVYVNGQKETKAGDTFSDDCDIVVKDEKPPFVSRGGLKLDKAVKAFNIDLHGMVCMDIGASTGGFTDCMLQNGALKVYSIDVGHGQLAWSLRNDKRVVCMEKTNFRYLTPDDIGEPIDFAGCDVSFISLEKILPAAYSIIKDGARMVCLIKPQFEAGRDKVGKHGVVRDINVHKEVIENVIEFAINSKFNIIGLDYSPIKGPEGNIEYLLYLGKGGNVGITDMQVLHEKIIAVTDAANASLTLI
ncbi:TlyA family RNA methyltransferase [Howardella ureilytica]|nr:TlyA family RNA methyltransferase [Lachnospiraceae bacterium]MDY2956235.1 TlyA family RNA methyltransferase [Lachnospiraceae bacterium]